MLLHSGGKQDWVYNLGGSLGHFLFPNSPVQWQTRVTPNRIFKDLDLIKIKIWVTSVDE